MKFKYLGSMLLLAMAIDVVYADDNVFLMDESTIKKQISENIPQIQQIESDFQAAKFKELEEKDKLTPEIFANYQNVRTNERAIISFMPVWSPVTQYEVGLRKKFTSGVSASLSTAVDSRSANLNGFSGSTQYDDVTTLVHSLNVNIDLWKDLLGKLTDAKIQSAVLSKKSAELQKEIQQNSYYISLRRLYWSLVANNEKIKISNALLKTATEQAMDAKKRQLNNIADAGEVARYESQVLSRKSALLYLEYQKESYLKQLRTLLPTLTNKQIKFNEYNLDKTIFDVLKCTQIISSNSGVPYEFSSYDEVAKLLQEIEFKQKQINDSFDDIDLKFSATYKLTGVGSEEINSNLYEGSVSRANEDLANNDRSGFAAGFSLNIPLGANKKSAKEAKVIFNQKRIKAQRSDIEFNLANTHEQVLKAIGVLTQVVKVQKMNSEKLEIRLKSMKKKYNQARISVNALIQDQDAKMNSDLSVIDTQLAAVNTLLDYFMVFSQTPCGFNRI